MLRVLNVAEKPSVAKAISEILGGGHATKRVGQSKFNMIFEFGYTLADGRQAHMSVTSVAGHILETDIEPKFAWGKCLPTELFFKAGLIKTVPKKFIPLANQLQSLARNSEMLILWLDCDREGEAIGYEVLSLCQEANPRIRVQRAHFSALIPRDIHNAMRTLTPPNPHMRDAVEARQEIDLRIGAAFTRWQTARFKELVTGGDGEKGVISYGPCQFPTLGFVCERYLKRRSFVPQGFWTIELEIKHDNAVAKFLWSRGRLYDRLCCGLLFESVVEDGTCVITDINNRQTTRSRPVPLSTVEMQKNLSRPPYRLSSTASMDIAEKLYQGGFISYPRTETDMFKQGTDLQTLIQAQTNEREWGEYAQSLLAGGFLYPRDGGHDDGAHPPIHPTRPPQGLNPQESQVYEYITRHFLACCSKDAVGQQSIVTAHIAGERFTARGLTITERNYLNVYKYDKWGEHSLPVFVKGQQYTPSVLMMRESKTEPPPLLTESDLITLMDKNGIGTDATIAAHIKTIQDRGYAEVTNHVFSPTPLGLGLVEGYDALDLQMAQPTLRAHMERELALVSMGAKKREDVVRETLTEMERVFTQVHSNADTIAQALEQYFDGIHAPASFNSQPHAPSAAPRPPPPPPAVAAPPRAAPVQPFPPASRPAAASNAAIAASSFIVPPVPAARPIVQPRNPARFDGPAGFVNAAAEQRDPSPQPGGYGGAGNWGNTGSASAGRRGGGGGGGAGVSGTGRRGSSPASYGAYGAGAASLGDSGGDFVSAYRREQQQLARGDAYDDAAMGAPAAPSYMDSGPGGGGGGGGDVPSWRYNPNAAPAAAGGSSYGGSSYGGGGGGGTDMSSVECYRCHQFGHFSANCETSVPTARRGRGGGAAAAARGGRGGTAARGRGSGSARGRGGRGGTGAGAAKDACYKVTDAGRHAWASDWCQLRAPR